MPALKGLYAEPLNPLSYSSFARTSWTQPEGSLPAHICEARVYNVNMSNWTVDVNTVFDQKNFLDLQVSSPYMHASQGEGFYCVPEVGAKCLVCTPGDGSPPFILSYVMPMVRLPSTSSEEAPAGTATQGGSPEGSGNYTWAGGRKKGKPGDIVARGRDGNFMVLHRGGVAQFGSTALAQRICVPLGNLVTDISQNYNHFNSGGAINWGIQDRGDADPQTEYRHTVRVYANDEYADIRFAAGYVKSPVQEPTGDEGEDSRNNQLGIGTEEDMVFEFALARNGFESDAGEFQGRPEEVKLRVFIDRAGNMMGRWEGSVNLRIKKKLYLTVDDDVVIVCKKNASITAEGKLDIVGAKGLGLSTGGGVVSLNEGTKAVATVGSGVKVALPPGLLTVMSLTVPPVPLGTVLAASPFLEGTITSGVPTLLG